MINALWVPVSASQLEIELQERVVDDHRDVDNLIEDEHTEEVFSSSSFSFSSSVWGSGQPTAAMREIRRE